MEKRHSSKRAVEKQCTTSTMDKNRRQLDKEEEKKTDRGVVVVGGATDKIKEKKSNLPRLLFLGVDAVPVPVPA